MTGRSCTFTVCMSNVVPKNSMFQSKKSELCFWILTLCNLWNIVSLLKYWFLTIFYKSQIAANTFTLKKSSFPMFMFCWFCLSRVIEIFHFLNFISFKYMWNMYLFMILQFWILLNILLWMIMLLLSRHSNEKQLL